MKRWLMVGAVAVALGSVGATQLLAKGKGVEAKIFGSTPNVVIRGVPAGGVPWVTSPGSRVELGEDGSVDVRIRGLVIGGGIDQAGNPVAPERIGIDPVTAVRIAVSWAVPKSVAPSGTLIQESPVLATDGTGNVVAHTSVGAPPPGGDRPIILVRAVNATTGASGAHIALSDFVANFGLSSHDGADD